METESDFLCFHFEVFLLYWTSYTSCTWNECIMIILVIIFTTLIGFSFSIFLFALSPPLSLSLSPPPAIWFTHFNCFCLLLLIFRSHCVPLNTLYTFIVWSSVVSSLSVWSVLITIAIIRPPHYMFFILYIEFTIVHRCIVSLCWPWFQVSHISWNKIYF